MMYGCDRVIRALQEMEQRLNHKLEKIMAGQADIDAAVAAFTGLQNDMQAQIAQLGADVTEIQAALAALPPSVDTTALNTLVASIAATQANLDNQVSSVSALVPPAPPAPAP